MFRARVKRSFKPKPLVVSPEPDLTNITELYNANQPCYDHDMPQYADQLRHLFMSLTIVCLELAIAIPTNKENISAFDTLCDYLIGDHYQGQSALFFQSMKINFEHLYLLLKNNTIEAECKIAAVNDLTPNLLNCGAGLHSHLLVCISKLMNTASINSWLADLRRDIIYQIACQQVIDYHIAIGSEIHVFNAFMRYAEQKGWEPAGAKAIQQIHDVHLARVLTYINHQAFETAYHAAYQPTAIIHYLAAQLAKTLRDLCLQEFIVENNIIDFQHNHYTIVASRLATFKHFASIEDLLDFSDDFRSARIKTDKEFHGLVARLCIAQQHFGPVKYVHTKSANTLTIIMTPKPQTVLLDDLLNEEATNYFCEHPALWPQIHFKFARYLFKKAPMSHAVYQFYRAQGQRDFSKLILTQVFAEALETNDLTVLNDLLHMKIDLSKPDANGTLPVITAAKAGDHWPALLLIAKKIKPTQLQEFGFEQALLYAVRDNDLATVKQFIALGIKPMQATFTETGNNIFHVAITHDCHDILVYLLTLTEPSGTNKHHLTPLAMAATLGKWEMVRVIASQYSATPYDLYGLTQTLMIALTDNKTDIILLILSRGISSEKLNRLFIYNEKNYALHLAVTHNNPDVVRALLTARASIMVRNANNLTPVQLAATLGHHDLVAIFCQFHRIDLDKLEPYFTNTYLDANSAGVTLGCSVM